MKKNLEKNIRIFSVLDRALAVPCNLKSALAGLNSEGRVLLLLFNLISGVDVVSLTQCYSIKLRQIWKEAAVDIINMCRKFLMLSWLSMIMDDRGFNLRCTELNKYG